MEHPPYGSSSPYPSAQPPAHSRQTTLQQRGALETALYNFPSDGSPRSATEGSLQPPDQNALPSIDYLGQTLGPRTTGTFFAPNESLSAPDEALDHRAARLMPNAVNRHLDHLSPARIHQGYFPSQPHTVEQHHSTSRQNTGTRYVDYNRPPHPRHITSLTTHPSSNSNRTIVADSLSLDLGLTSENRNVLREFLKNDTLMQNAQLLAHFLRQEQVQAQLNSQLGDIERNVNDIKKMLVNSFVVSKEAKSYFGEIARYHILQHLKTYFPNTLASAVKACPSILSLVPCVRRPHLTQKRLKNRDIREKYGLTEWKGKAQSKEAVLAAIHAQVNATRSALRRRLWASITKESSLDQLADTLVQKWAPAVSRAPIPQAYLARIAFMRATALPLHKKSLKRKSSNTNFWTKLNQKWKDLLKRELNSTQWNAWEVKIIETDRLKFPGTEDGGAENIDDESEEGSGTDTDTSEDDDDENSAGGGGTAPHSN